MPIAVAISPFTSLISSNIYERCIERNQVVRGDLSETRRGTRAGSSSIRLAVALARLNQGQMEGRFLGQIPQGDRPLIKIKYRRKMFSRISSITSIIPACYFMFV